MQARYIYKLVAKIRKCDVHISVLVCTSGLEGQLVGRPLQLSF